MRCELVNWLLSLFYSPRAEAEFALPILSKSDRREGAARFLATAGSEPSTK